MRGSVGGVTRRGTLSIASTMLGPRLATENRRSFSEAQLRAGLNELTFQTRGADIERLGVDESMSINFGNAKSGTGDTSVVSRVHEGATIERLGVDESASCTFRADKVASRKTSRQHEVAAAERPPSDEATSTSVLFGLDACCAPSLRDDEDASPTPPAPPPPNSMGFSAGS